VGFHTRTVLLGLGFARLYYEDFRFWYVGFFGAPTGYRPPWSPPCKMFYSATIGNGCSCCPSKVSRTFLTSEERLSGRPFLVLNRDRVDLDFISRRLKQSQARQADRGQPLYPKRTSTKTSPRVSSPDGLGSKPPRCTYPIGQAGFRGPTDYDLFFEYFSPLAYHNFRPQFFLPARNASNLPGTFVRAFMSSSNHDRSPTPNKEPPTPHASCSQFWKSFPPLPGVVRASRGAHTPLGGPCGGGFS